MEPLVKIPAGTRFTLTAWLVWLTGMSLLFISEYFRLAASGTPLIWIPNWAMFVAMVFVEALFIWLAYRGAAALIGKTRRVGATVLQVLVGIVAWGVAGQIAIRAFLLPH